MHRLIFVLILSVLGGQPAFASTTSVFPEPIIKEAVELEFQGSHKFGGVYWAGHGVEVIWKPVMSGDSVYDTATEITLMPGVIGVKIVDVSNLTDTSAGTWAALSLKRKHTLRKHIVLEPEAVADRYGNLAAELDQEHYLINGNPIPIYLYDTKENDTHYHDEYLHSISYVSVSLKSGEAKAWWERLLSDSQERLEERRKAVLREKQEELLNYAAGTLIALVALAALWRLRFRISAALTWFKVRILRLGNKGANVLKAPAELEALKEKLRRALADEDYEEAARISSLAAQVKKLNL